MQSKIKIVPPFQHKYKNKRNKQEKKSNLGVVFEAFRTNKDVFECDPLVVVRV